MVEKAVIIVNKKRVKEIYGGKCANLAEPVEHRGRLGIHHIIFRKDRLPIEKEEKSNYILLCRKCEQHLHSMADRLKEEDRY